MEELIGRNTATAQAQSSSGMMTAPAWARTPMMMIGIQQIRSVTTRMAILVAIRISSDNSTFLPALLEEPLALTKMMTQQTTTSKKLRRFTPRKMLRRGTRWACCRLAPTDQSRFRLPRMVWGGFPSGRRTWQASLIGERSRRHWIGHRSHCTRAQRGCCSPNSTQRQKTRVKQTRCRWKRTVSLRSLKGNATPSKRSTLMRVMKNTEASLGQNGQGTSNMAGPGPVRH